MIINFAEGSKIPKNREEPIWAFMKGRERNCETWKMLIETSILIIKLGMM